MMTMECAPGSQLPYQLRDHFGLSCRETGDGERILPHAMKFAARACCAGVAGRGIDEVRCRAQDSCGNRQGEKVDFRHAQTSGACNFH
jgi:hypothetical protein